MGELWRRVTRKKERKKKNRHRHTPFFLCVLCYALFLFVCGSREKKSLKDGMDGMDRWNSYRSFQKERKAK